MTDTKDKNNEIFTDTGCDGTVGRIDAQFNIDRELERWHRDIRYNSAFAEVNKAESNTLYNAWHNRKEI